MQGHIAVTHRGPHYHFCSTKNIQPCPAQADTVGATYRRVLLAVPLQDHGTGKGNRICLEHHFSANPRCWASVASAHKAFFLFYMKDQAGPGTAKSHMSWKIIFPFPPSIWSTAMKAKRWINCQWTDLDFPFNTTDRIFLLKSHSFLTKIFFQTCIASTEQCICTTMLFFIQHIKKENKSCHFLLQITFLSLKINTTQLSQLKAICVWNKISFSRAVRQQ